MLIASGRMRCSHLDLLWKLEESFAHGKHSVDHLLREAGVDQVGKADISAGSIELFADALGILSLGISDRLLSLARCALRSGSVTHGTSTVSEFGKVNEGDRRVDRRHNDRVSFG